VLLAHTITIRADSHVEFHRSARGGATGNSRIC